MRLLLALALLAQAPSASGETHRIAVIVGNNRGRGDRPMLHYAEADAAKLAGVLLEIGGVEPRDRLLLQGRSAAALRDALTAVRARVASWHEVASTSVVLLFFFSGHSDGEALELGSDRLSFRELRRLLAAAGADLRVAVVDSCRSGALLAAKGGRPGAGFAIRLTDDVASTGEALLTSSAADELALESREIRGSFFTHHLVSGLRGAADRSRDGRVTLSEAYDYAFAHTVSATAETLVGPQHPGYDYRVSGEGDLVLTDLTQRSSTLELPLGFDRILVQASPSHEVLAEVPSGMAARVAVPPGRYDVRAWRAGSVLLAQVAVARGASSAVAASDFQPTGAVATLGKGDAPKRRLGITLALSAGVQGAASAAVREQGAVSLGVRGTRPSGWSATVSVATARGAALWETDAFATAGYRLGTERGRWRLHAALEAGGGLVSQNLDGGGALRTPAILAVPRLATSVRVAETIALALEAQVYVGWIRKDGRDATLLAPGASLGVLWSP